MPTTYEQLESSDGWNVAVRRPQAGKIRSRTYSPRFAASRSGKEAHHGIHHRRDKRNFL